MFKIKMKDRYAVQDKVKRTYRVRLPKGFKSRLLGKKYM